MAAKTKKAPNFQAFEMRRMKRSEFHGCSYNPRKMTPEARKRLERGLKQHGLVVPICVNLRTMNIVGGHQRVKSLDSLYQTKDYELDCAVIDVDEKKEKELNILLNNTDAMGDFDEDMLADLLNEVDYDAAGFDADTLEKMMGDSFDIDILTDEDVEAKRERYEEGIAHRKRMVAASGRESGIEYYTNIVFPDDVKRQEFFAMLGMKGDLMVDGLQVIERLRTRFKRNY